MSLVPALDLRLSVPANEQTLANVEAEFALLGSVMYDNAALHLSGDIVRGEHFYEPLVGWLFDKARAMVAKGQRVEPITLHDIARSYGTAYEDMGGIALLVDMVDRAPPAANAPDYARVIFDCFLRRNMLVACQDGVRALSSDRDRPAFDIIADLRRAVQSVEESAAPEDASMISAPEAAAQALAVMSDLAMNGRVRGKMTGLRCIDRRLGGLRPGTLLFIGGRPGMGKTALARAIAHGAAVRNPDDDFLFMGLEMGPEEMMQRELSSITQEMGEGVEFQAMAKGSLTPLDLMIIEQAAGRVPQNLILDDCHTLSIDDVRRKVWALARKKRLKAVVIDYLQLMTRPPANGRNDAAILGDMTKALKQIARQWGLCMIVLSQLSREVEKRDDKRPQLPDLRESGSIEQDADAVLFPFREFYYVERAEPKAGTAEYRDWEMRCEDLRRRLDVICGKQRQGPVGTDRQRYFAEYDLILDEPQ